MARRRDLEQRVLILAADAIGAAQAGRQGQGDDLADRRVIVAGNEGDQL
jgi:hypothetical protein